MYDDPAGSRHFAIVARAIAFIRAHARAQPSLEEIAAAVHLSPHHLQRLFAEWAGISPKRFLQYLTKEHARRQLARSAGVLSAAEEAGLSSTSRLHDLMVSCEAMTPGEIKSGGRGLAIGYGFASSPFGGVLAAWTARGVCHFAFCVADEAAMLAELAALWPAAVRASRNASVWARSIWPSWSLAPSTSHTGTSGDAATCPIGVWTPASAEPMAG